MEKQASNYRVIAKSTETGVASREADFLDTEHQGDLEGLHFPLSCTSFFSWLKSPLLYLPGPWPGVRSWRPLFIGIEELSRKEKFIACVFSTS